MQIRTGHAEVVGTAAARLNVEQCLTDLGNRPLDQKRTTALYIPKTNRDYWDMRQVGPGSTPFIAPAFSGMTMVEGLPEFDDIGWAAIGWGYPQYRLPTRSEAPSDHSQEAIAKARAEGFHVLLILDTTSSHSCQIRKIELFPSVNGMPTSEVPTL